MPRLNCDDRLNIMTEVKGNFTTNYQTEHIRKSTCIEGNFERNYREKNMNERDISNTVDSHFQ